MHLILGLAVSRGYNAIKTITFAPYLWSFSCCFPTDGIKRPSEILGLHHVFPAAPPESFSNSSQQYPPKNWKTWNWFRLFAQPGTRGIGCSDWPCLGHMPFLEPGGIKPYGSSTPKPPAVEVGEVVSQGNYGFWCQDIGKWMLHRPRQQVCNTEMFFCPFKYPEAYQTIL